MHASHTTASDNANPNPIIGSKDLGVGTRSCRNDPGSAEELPSGE